MLCNITFEGKPFKTIVFLVIVGLPKADIKADTKADTKQTQKQTQSSHKADTKQTQSRHTLDTTSCLLLKPTS